MWLKLKKNRLCYNLLNCQEFFYSRRNSRRSRYCLCVHCENSYRENKKGNRTFDFLVRYFKRRSLNVNRFFPLQFIISRAFLPSLWRESWFPLSKLLERIKFRYSIIFQYSHDLHPFSTRLIQTIFNLPRTELKPFTIQFLGGSLHFQGPRDLSLSSRKTRWSSARYEVSPIILTAATGTELMKGPGRVGLVAVARAVLRSCRG